MYFAVENSTKYKFYPLDFCTFCNDITELDLKIQTSLISKSLDDPGH